MRSARALTVSLVLAFGGPGAGTGLDTVAFLRTYAGFSAEDVRKVEGGQVIAHSIAADGTEVALAAAAIVRVPIDFYLERFRAIESFKRSPEVLQIGRFSSPPSAGDLRTLTLDSGDVESLRECRPGHCAVKLDAPGIRRLAARGVDVDAALRDHLAAYAARYLREGHAALIEYHDGRQPRPLSRELSQIVARSAYLRPFAPAVHSAVGDFRGALPSGLQQFLYWSKEKPPGKPIVSLTHAIVQPETGGIAVVATKQLYASHYMTASLGLTVLVNRGTSAAPRTLLIYVNRTHVDIFDGVLGKLKRPLVRARARGSAEQMLERMRQRLEAEFRASGRQEASARR